MDGHNPYGLMTTGPERFVLGGSFQTNGASNPAATTYRGSAGGLSFTVTYAATGVYTVTLASNLRLPAQPMSIALSPQFAVLATDWFDCAVVGETTLNASTRSFVIQAHRSGVANAPANTAGNRINFIIYASNNTGA